MLKASPPSVLHVKTETEPTSVTTEDTIAASAYPLLNERGENDGFVLRQLARVVRAQDTVTTFEGAESGPVPRLLVAATRNANAVPDVRPVIVWVVAVETNVRFV
jgi:hypothetical protein